MELNRAKTNPKCSIHWRRSARCRSSRPKSIAQQNLPWRMSSAKPEWSKIWEMVSSGDRNGTSVGLAKQRGSWQRNSPKLEENKIATFFSNTAEWRHPSQSKIKPEAKEFVVVSGASMHKLDTVMFYRIPTTVVTAIGEVQKHEEATVCVKGMDIFLTVRILEKSPAVISLGKLCEDHRYSCDWTSGQKKHVSSKNGVRTQWYTEKLRSNRGSRVVNDVSYSSSSSGTTSPTSSRQKGTTSLKPIRASVECQSADENGQEDPSANRTQNPEPIRNGSREITARLVFFRNTRMAARIHRRVSEHRDSQASSSHETSWGSKRRIFLGNHSIFTFRKSEFDICQRTKIKRAPCLRRTGEVVPRAENFGELITAEYTILGESCESRKNHRYALLVQYLATQWIQSYPCNKKKNLTGKRKELAKVLGTNQKTKSYLLWQFLGMRGQAAVRSLSEGTCADVHYADEKWRIAKNESRVERDEDRSFRRKNIKKKRDWKNDRRDVCRP